MKKHIMILLAALLVLCLAGCSGTGPGATSTINADDEADIPTVFSDMSIELDKNYNGFASIARFDSRWRMEEKEHENGKTVTLYPHQTEDTYVFTYDETKSKDTYDFNDERVVDTFVTEFGKDNGYEVQSSVVTSINRENAIEIHFTQKADPMIYGVYYFLQWDGYDISLTYTSQREIPKKELRAIQMMVDNISVMATVKPEMTDAAGTTETPGTDESKAPETGTPTPSATE